MMLVSFTSDTNFSLFTEFLDLRYPSNLLELDKEARTVRFLGGDPNAQIMRLVVDHNGVMEDDD